MPQVLIVSNRLPVSVKKVDGELEFSSSIGGLATGLSSYVRDKRNKWIGWPGIASDDLTELEKKQITKRLERDNYFPVFLSRAEVDDFYNGYSNALLWPLFHSLRYKEPEKHKKWLQAYQRINQKFSDAVTELAKPSSTVWVHDYQLMLMPEQLRAKRVDLNIGFFLHIPFPPRKLFTKLPEYKKLLKGVLGADLVGFHTKNYVADFMENCSYAGIGIAGDDQIILPLRTIKITDFPMGIDYEKFAEANKLPEVKQAVRKYKKKYQGLKIIAAVDRLDISKGFAERLAAYREFLVKNPKLRRKVVFVLVGAPSRTDMAVYQKLGTKIAKLAAEINSTFGTKNWQPVDYINHAIPFEEVTALFQIADVAFIAPIKDGMNLAAKEFVASSHSHGVLILSNTAGAAQELSDALIVNPLDISSSVAALQTAIEMPKRELKQRLSRMQDQLSTNTVHHWATNFVQALQQPVPYTATFTATLNRIELAKIVAEYSLAKKRLLLLDYDGSLVPFSEHYADAHPPESLMKLLKTLSKDRFTEVVIISGRSASDLEKWFSDLPVTLIAEHGASMKRIGQQSWTLVETMKTGWKARVIEILENYIALTPEASIEIKNHSVVWHYRKSPPFYAQKYAVVIKRALKPLLVRHDLELRQGNKVLEIKSPEVGKGLVIKRLGVTQYDFILAMGDDFTDEDMFTTLPASAVTIKIGRGKTAARYRLSTVDQVRRLLQALSA